MKTETKIVIALIIIIAYGIFSMAGVMAYGSTRANACRNYHLFAHQETGREEVDSEFCGQAMPTMKQAKNEETIVSMETPTIIVTIVPSVTETPTVETPTTPIITTPEVTPSETPTPETPAVSDNGNPGNDKPVGNAGEKCAMGGFCERETEGNRGRSN